MCLSLSLSRARPLNQPRAMATTGVGAISKAFYIRNNIGQWNAEKIQLMQDFKRLQELVGLLQVS